MKMNPIVREVSNLVIPPILVFALYVQFHGDYGPGGGFQAGVLFAAAIILHTLVYGLESTQKLFNPTVMRFFVSMGLLLYIGVGVVCMFKGGLFLDYNVLTESHGAHNVHGQELGILLVELGVGITVAAVMITIFYSFCSRQVRGRAE